MSRREEKTRIDVIIGKNIVTERKLRKITRDELAEMMELTSSHMGLIERGERGATAVTLSKLSRILDVPIDRLFSYSNVNAETDNANNANEATASSKKLSSLVSCLNVPEINFVIHVVKGIKRAF